MTWNLHSMFVTAERKRCTESGYMLALKLAPSFLSNCSWFTFTSEHRRQALRCRRSLGTVSSAIVLNPSRYKHAIKGVAVLQINVLNVLLSLKEVRHLWGTRREPAQRCPRRRLYKNNHEMMSFEGLCVCGVANCPENVSSIFCTVTGLFYIFNTSPFHWKLLFGFTKIWNVQSNINLQQLLLRYSQYWKININFPVYENSSVILTWVNIIIIITFHNAHIYKYILLDTGIQYTAHMTIWHKTQQYILPNPQQ